MIDYCLFIKLKEGNKKEFVQGLSESYDKQFKEFEKEKIKYIHSSKMTSELSKEIFTSEHCINPEVTPFERIHTSLKSNDFDCIIKYEKYNNYNNVKNLTCKNLINLKDELWNTYNILESYGVVKDNYSDIRDFSFIVE